MAIGVGPVAASRSGEECQVEEEEEWMCVM